MNHDNYLPDTIGPSQSVSTPRIGAGAKGSSSRTQTGADKLGASDMPSKVCPLDF